MVAIIAMIMIVLLIVTVVVIIGGIVGIVIIFVLVSLVSFFAKTYTLNRKPLKASMIAALGFDAVQLSPAQRSIDGAQGVLVKSRVWGSGLKDQV